MNGDQTAGDLAQVNEILEAILSNMGDAVIVAGRDEKFLIFNPAAQRIFGEGATDTTSTNWPLRHGLYLPDKVTLFPSDQTPLARAIRGEETNRVEMFVRQAQAPRGGLDADQRPAFARSQWRSHGRCHCLPGYHRSERRGILSSR